MNKLIQYEDNFICLDSYFCFLLNSYRKDTQYRHPIFDHPFNVYEPLYWSFKDLNL